MSSAALSKKLFWLLARCGIFVYSRFPLFGPLNAAIGIMHQGDAYLAIDRNDGRGVSFPGGLQRPWESPAQALIREVREETGLNVTRYCFKLRYYSSADIPVHVSVYEIEARGQLQASWEGKPCWLRADELRGCLLKNQWKVLELIVLAET
jgi:8-oxo-dGTP pyrophosphatase MutT (NUDIX family)